MTPGLPSAQTAERVDQLITAQAKSTPQAIAVACGARSITYDELERLSGRVADRLRGLGIARGSLVGIHLDRSVEMLCAVIGVMKAGAAYVPLDPDFPADRLAYMVRDAALPAVITQVSLSASAPPGEYLRIDMAELIATQEPPIGSDSADGAQANDLVYVLYTSGSTGKPKGVALEHRSIVNFLLSMQHEPGMSAGDRLVAVTTLSFDIAALELFLPLVAGGTVVIASREQAADGSALRALLETCDATAMQATPTTWRLLVEAGWQGSPGFKALCGGEVLPRGLASMLLPRCGELWNMYGPTETAIWSTIFRLSAEGAPILIGRPIANTRIYVLDKAGRPCPTGIPGEIHIAGAGVARGYLNREELTAERFVRDPFSDVQDARMYRTGDSGRYLADGNLEFRGRLDNQVKIRGFRVELGEVEVALSSHPAVKQSAAKILEFRPGDARLVAYVLPNGDPPAADLLREHLRARLPHYMVPQHFRTVTHFPLTPNGKIDRAQLPPPDRADLLSEAYVEPRTPAERSVAQVFREVLAVDRVGAESSFFDLGGHSVLATRAVSVLRKRVHEGITLRMLFEAPSAALLGREIDRLMRDASADELTEREEFQF